MGVKYFPTSVGSLWANGHAERSIRTIKDALRNFILQEKITENWDKYITLFTNAHNQSTSIYGYAPEELMFGYRQPSPHDLLQFWPNARSQEEYADHIFPLIEEKRNKTQERSEANKEKNRNFKNVNRIKKEFKIGQIVACCQLQVSTGPNSSMKPKHKGPYAIIALTKDKCSCIIENLNTGSQSKEHFTNLIPINYHPNYNRVHTTFDEEIEEMINNLKNNKYNIKASTKRLIRNPKSSEPQINEEEEDNEDLDDPDNPREERESSVESSDKFHGFTDDQIRSTQGSQSSLILDDDEDDENGENDEDDEEMTMMETTLKSIMDKDQKDKEIEKEDKKKETMKEILDNMQKKEKEKRD